MKLLYFRPHLIVCLLLAFYACKNSNTNKIANGADSLKRSSNIPPELQALNAAINKDTSLPGPYYNRALYFLQKREFNQALFDMTKVMKRDSMRPEYYLTISDIYLFGNHTSKSIDALEHCLNIDPKNTEAMLKLGELFFYVKKYEQSIKVVNEALKINQYNARAYYLKGLNFKEAGDTSKAISCMITATEQDPDYYSAYEALGIMYAARKNKLAIDYFNNALRINPKSDESVYNIGKFYQDKGLFDQAIETYQQLIKMNPQFRFAYYNMGAIALVRSNTSDAISQFTLAIKADTGYVEAYFARGVCYERIGKKELSIRDYKHALSLRDNYQPAQEALKKLQ